MFVVNICVRLDPASWHNSSLTTKSPFVGVFMYKSQVSSKVLMITIIIRLK